MRQTFLILLLLNVGFFAWQFQKQKHPPVWMQTETLPNDKVQKLVLVTELDDSENEKLQPADSAQANVSEKSQNAKPETELEPGPTFVCYSIGPFFNMKSANEVSVLLGEAGVTAATRETDDKVHKDYWVHLPAENWITSARQIVRDLKARKISDISVVTVDDDHYVVSLGVFSLDESVQRRYSQFVSMGYNPVIEDRFKIVTRYWIDAVDNAPSLLTPQIWQDISAKYPGISREENDC